MKIYRVNEIFYSIQGEGIRTGTANVFVRFSGCNLECSAAVEGFDCDTEFISGQSMEGKEIAEEIVRLGGSGIPVILTGGEPALQIDDELVTRLKHAGHYLAIETNGTKPLPEGLDWICVSPKTAEHTLALKRADEVKYVRHAGQGIPRPQIEAMHKLISPAFQSAGTVRRDDLEWCIKLVKENPEWRLSLQVHKLLKVR